MGHFTVRLDHGTRHRRRRLAHRKNDGAATDQT